MSTVRQVRISQLRASLRECNRVLEEFPPGSMELLQQLERDEVYGASMTDATFTTTCARCAAPLESTDATAEAVSKAHEARCFVVGDAVECRVHAGKWWPATISVVISRDDFEVEHTDLMGTRSWWRAARANLRRISRPEQAARHRPGCPSSSLNDDPRCASPAAIGCACASPLPSYTKNYAPPIAHRDIKPENVPVDPLDVKYDDVALRTLLIVDQLQRVDRGDRVPLSRHPLTPDQRAAVSAHWSSELRSRIAASSERERLTVVAPDLELETANCKDAE